MTIHVESLMQEQESEARANAVVNGPRGLGGSSTRNVEGVSYCARTGANNSILWTRDGKRISRKKAAIQIGELLQ